MREKLEERLSTLTTEFRAGQEMLADLETRQANLRLTLARISGAMQVLEELLQQDETTLPAAAKSVAAAGNER
ncbi:MAG: hypothetical protein U0Y68_25685 [Blastocatellia bacterium]